MAITYQETVQVVLDLVRQKEEAEAIVKQQTEYIRQREELIKQLHSTIDELKVRITQLESIQQMDRVGCEQSKGGVS
jgi:hypothetical protein